MITLNELNLSSKATKLCNDSKKSSYKNVFYFHSYALASIEETGDHFKLIKTFMRKILHFRD